MNGEGRDLLLPDSNLDVPPQLPCLRSQLLRRREREREREKDFTEFTSLSDAGRLYSSRFYVASRPDDAATGVAPPLLAYRWQKLCLRD